MSWDWDKLKELKKGKISKKSFIEKCTDEDGWIVMLIALLPKVFSLLVGLFILISIFHFVIKYW